MFCDNPLAAICTSWNRGVLRYVEKDTLSIKAFIKVLYVCVALL